MKHMTIITLACAWLAVAVAASGKVHASMTQEVDLFPSQTWSSLINRGAEALAADVAPDEEASASAVEGASAPDSAAAEPEPPMVPLQAVGEWIEGTDRIIVVESRGQTYLLCQRCAIDGAVLPGGTVAQQYQLEALEPSRAVLQDPQGRVLHIDLTPLAQ